MMIRTSREGARVSTVRCGAGDGTPNRCPWTVAVPPDRWVRELLTHWAQTHDKEDK